MSLASQKNYFNFINCPLCKSNSYSVLYKSNLTSKDFDPNIISNNLKNTLSDYRKHGQIVRCNTCNLVYSNPREHMEPLLKGYRNVIDKEYIKTQVYRKILLSEHLLKVEQFKKRGTLLDVGCFVGLFLELAKQKKWKVFGIEPSIWAVKIAKKRGIKILGERIEKAKLKSNFFDVITFWDTIEHIADPKTVLKTAHKALKKDGIIAISTPNIESLFAKILGKYYPLLIRMHVILFSPKTLSRLLEETGFEIIYSKNYARTFPLYYILERIKVAEFFFKKMKSFIDSYPKVANFPIRLNFMDAFIILAKKKA